MKNIFTLEYVKETAESILKKVKAIELENYNITITTSIGVQMITQACNYQDIFQKADALMYEAKKSGGNQYRMNV